MSKMLDLSVFQEDTLDVKTVKGNIIHVKKPSEKIALKILSYQSKAEEVSQKEKYDKDSLNKLMDMFKELTKDILGYNKDEVIIDDKYLKDNEINYSMQVAILNAYTDFMNDITSSPNSKSPQNHRKKAKK